jgi:outer membrane protein OmpA-like peptidoglycan-associated protein
MLLRFFGRILYRFIGVFIASWVIVTGAQASPFNSLKADIFASKSATLITKIRADRLPRAVLRGLREKGYTNIEIQNQNARRVRVKACRRNIRYMLRVKPNGQIINSQSIGACRVGARSAPRATPRTPPRAAPRRVPRATPRSAPRAAPRRAPQAAPRRLPRAAVQGGLSLPQIRQKLRNRGFKEIHFTDRNLPVYGATACKNGKRFRLKMNRFGDVNNRDRIGRCGVVRDRAPEIRPRPRRDHVDDRRPRRRVDEPRRNVNGKRPPEIRKLLQKRGFDRITFIDRQLPIYVVRACRNNRRMQLRLDRFGKIRNRERLGRCQQTSQGMKPPQIRRALRTKGFSRILFKDHRLPVYVVEACRHDRKFELRVNRFARIMRKSDVGRCRTGHLSGGMGPREVADILRRRGYREIDFFDRSPPGYGVTACKRGQKFRMRLNRFAEIRNRRRTGFCRPPVSAPPPVDDYYEEVDEEEIDGTGQVDPETCQTYLDALVRRNRIHFDVNSAALRRGTYGLLKRLSHVMQRCPSSRIEIAGHTDSDGSRDYNRELSRDRASTVVEFLTRDGISQRRMTAYGYGEDQPLMRHEQTERDKARNRRIEFTVIWGDDDF